MLGCSTPIATSATDKQCKFDNAVYQMYTWDVRADLTGTQNVVVHTMDQHRPDFTCG